MAKSRAAGPMKDFSNIEEVFLKMLELGFFFNDRHRSERLDEITDPYPSPHAGNEFWYSNGVVEFKIFKHMFGAYELCNFRGIISPALDEIFELAEIPRIK